MVKMRRVTCWEQHGAGRARCYFAVRLTCGSGPKAGGGTRWCVAASYAEATLITAGSLPGPAQTIMLIGIGCGSVDSTVPVTAIVSLLVWRQHVLRFVDDLRVAGRHIDLRSAEQRRERGAAAAVGAIVDRPARRLRQACMAAACSRDSRTHRCRSRTSLSGRSSAARSASSGSSSPSGAARGVLHRATAFSALTRCSSFFELRVRDPARPILHARIAALGAGTCSTVNGLCGLSRPLLMRRRLSFARQRRLTRAPARPHSRR